jgi:SNF2 family DNA or RNA helicase
MLNPQKFWSLQNFLDTWVEYYMHGNRPKQGGIRNIPKFKEFTKDLFIRRERDEVMPELPKTNRVRLTCEIEDHARKAYEEEVSEFVKWYNELIISGEEDNASSESGMLARLNRMRHIIALAKIPYTLDWVEDFVEETERNLIIGVHHKDVRLLLVSQLKKAHPDINILAMTASQSDDERNKIKAQFINGPRAIIVASTLSAGEGTDGLQKACYDMVIHERQWNPMNEEQLEDRLARIGSIAPQKVNVTYIHADDSTDIQLDAIVEQKRRQFHAVMNKGEMAQWHTGSIISELSKMLVQRGARK